MFVTGASMHLYPWNMEFQYISFIGWPLQAPAVSWPLVGPNIKPIPLLAGLMRTFLTTCFDWRWTRVFPHKPARREAPQRDKGDVRMSLTCTFTSRANALTRYPACLGENSEARCHHAKVDQLSIRRFAKRFGVFLKPQANVHLYLVLQSGLTSQNTKTQKAMIVLCVCVCWGQTWYACLAPGAGRLDHDDMVCHPCEHERNVEQARHCEAFHCAAFLGNFASPHLS